MTRVFISYSRADIDFVQRLARDLQQAGLDVWWDLSDIRGSDVWERKIQDGLDSSKYFIIVLTPDALASRWVRREYLSADSKGLTIIPLKVKEYEDLPLTLRDLQPVDVFKRTYEESLAELLTILKAETLTNTSLDRSLPPEAENQKLPVNVERTGTISALEVGGTVSFIVYLLLAGFHPVIPSGTFISLLMAACALLSGLFLLSSKQIPAPVVFRYAAALYVLGDSLNNYFFYDGNLIVLLVISASALICAGILATTFRSSKKAIFYAAISLALFLILIAVRVILGLFEIYPDQILWLIVGAITSILLFMDL